MGVAPDSPRAPGDLLLHPVSIAALAAVILNDRLLKTNVPSAFTGKLSDFAGLIYFPLFVVASIEVLRWLVRRRPWELGPRSVEAAALLTGAAFILIKTWSPAAELYRSRLGVLLWPAYAIGSLVQERALPGVRRFGVIEDRSDLIALPALFVAVWLAHRLMSKRIHPDRSIVGEPDGAA